MPIGAVNINLNSHNRTRFKTKNMSSAKFNQYAQDSFQSNAIKNNSNISFKGLVLKPNLFKEVAARAENFKLGTQDPAWLKLIARQEPLYERETTIILDEFSRDYNRGIFSDAYKTLRDKTQVFIHPSDLITNRMLHSTYVGSSTGFSAEFMGMNPKLSLTTGTLHDIGQPPFAHDGEVCINNLMKENRIASDFWQGEFWHEKNGLRVVDDIATLVDPQGYHKNLNLTYAVRDGIISHCGEVDENGLMPRKDYMDLRLINKDNRRQAFTWEGCNTKIHDKICYIGTDIEDALKLKFLPPEKKKELVQQVEDLVKSNFKDVNNTVLMNHFSTNLCLHSNPENGLRFSQDTFQLMNTVKKSNYADIYNPIKKAQVPYINDVLSTIFVKLSDLYQGKQTLMKLDGKKKPDVISNFREWLVKYSNAAIKEREEKKYANKILYTNIEDENNYKLSIIDYISGMTDGFAKKSFEELTSIG